MKSKDDEEEEGERVRCFVPSTFGRVFGHRSRTAGVGGGGGGGRGK